MDRTAFERVAEKLDQLEDVAEDALTSDATEPLRAISQQIADILGPRYMVHLGLRVTVVDEVREAVLPLLTEGVTTLAGEESYRTHDDCTWHRYLVDGSPQVVPHDRCPVCWDEWILKYERPTCPSCGVSLGEEVTILLDTDVCPFCEQGRITAAEPTCKRCGFAINPAWVTWG